MPPQKLRLLHSSDWHLGRALYGRRRLPEFSAFLDWLAQTLVEEKVDVLLLAGDVFDTLNPSPSVQALYYRFLAKASAACRHVLIIAGNHDSPVLLSAPAALLKALNIHVVGSIGERAEEEVLVLDQDGRPALIVAAVPYPRDRDLRLAEAGESGEDKERKLLEAVRAHYQAAADQALRLREELGEDLPLVAMGHLFAAGGATVEGDGVRHLYVGSLGRVPAEVFPDCFDYVALGHLHQPQLLGGCETRRYSGAPLPMTFNEAGRPKSVVLVDLEPGRTSVRPLEVPLFQRLERISGDWAVIEAALAGLIEEKALAWLEIEYEGREIIPDLRARLAELTADSGLEILRIGNKRISDLSLEAAGPKESLDDLDDAEVFRRCLAAHQVPEEDWPDFLAAYGEIFRAIREDGDGRR